MESLHQSFLIMHVCVLIFTTWLILPDINVQLRTYHNVRKCKSSAIATSVSSMSIYLYISICSLVYEQIINASDNGNNAVFRQWF